MEKYETEPPLNPKIQQAVVGIFEEVDENFEMYYPPAGVVSKVGETDWIIYVEDYEVKILRDWQTMEHPVIYKVKPDGYILKNPCAAEWIDGGIYFDSDHECVLEDEHEAFTLRAIVRAAHEVNRSTH